jgi:colicin import membrane protein
MRWAVGLVAAALLCGAPARAQDEAERIARTGTGEPDWHVTVLMILKPGTYGIRRGAHIADPVLCTLDGCYVSTGPERPSLFLPGRKALGVGNTLGIRAGACRRSLGCVFRDMVLEYPGFLQPVDLHVLKHDRRQPQKVLADSDCHLSSGRLTCHRGIYTEDYALWIVPERLAESAGPDVLDRALRDGLTPSRSAEARPRAIR